MGEGAETGDRHGGGAPANANVGRTAWVGGRVAAKGIDRPSLAAVGGGRSAGLWSRVRASAGTGGRFGALAAPLRPSVAADGEPRDAGDERARPTAADERQRKRSRREAGPRYSACRAPRGCGRFLQHLLGNLVPGKREDHRGSLSQPTRGTGAPEVQDSGERPRREAGARYSACRAPRGCGRSPQLLFPERQGSRAASPRSRTSALSPLGAIGREAIQRIDLASH